MTTPDTPEPAVLYERFTVTYPSGTVIPSFYYGGEGVSATGRSPARLVQGV